MWVRLPLNRRTAIGGLILVSSMTGVCAHNDRLDPLKRYRSNAEVHGLYEIREAARAFLSRESAGRKVAYRPMDPSLQVVVPRCLVPLTARWARKTIYNDGPGVDVFCKRSVNKKHNYSWDVFVPLFDPDVAQKWRLLNEANNKRDAAAGK